MASLFCQSQPALQPSIFGVSTPSARARPTVFLKSFTNQMLPYPISTPFVCPKHRSKDQQYPALPSSLPFPIVFPSQFALNITTRSSLSLQRRDAAKPHNARRRACATCR